MDDFKPAATRYIEDEVVVVWLMAELPMEPLVLSDSSVYPFVAVRDLGAWVDSGVTMTVHVDRTVVSCFATRLMTQCYDSSLPCPCSVASGLLQRHTHRIACLSDQQVTVSPQCRRSSVLWCKLARSLSLLLRELHWLRVPERIEYKLLCSCVPLSLRSRPRIFST